MSQLEEFKPSSDINFNQLQEQRIRLMAKKNGYFVCDKTLCITGHVDSGKTGTTASILKFLNLIDQSKFTSEKQTLREKKGEEAEISDLVVGTRIIEKGSEAKDRGMTMEVRPFEVKLKARATFKEQALHDEFVSMLKELETPYEISKESDGEYIVYDTRIILLDSPGHKNYIHNTTNAICTSDIQFALVPNDASEGPLDLSKVSATTISHARLGNSQNNTLVFLLSKSDVATAANTLERVKALPDNIKSKLGIRPDKVMVIPTSSQGLKPNNVLVKSDLDCFKGYKGSDGTILVKDYRDSNVTYPVEKCHLDIAADIFYYVFPQVCLKGTYQKKGCLITVTEVATATGHGVVYCGQVLNGVASIDDTLTSARHPGAAYKIESMEQFKKSVKNSAVKSLIGIKLKHSKKDPAPKVRDLLHCDFDPTNVPKECEYMRVKLLFFPPDNKKTREYKLGAEFSAITIQRHTISIVKIHSTKSTVRVKGKVKEEINEHSDSNPINNFLVSGTLLVDCTVRFKYPVCLPTIDQAHYGYAGNILVNRDVAGSVKFITQLTSNTQDEDLFAKMKSKGKAKGAA